MLKLGNRQFSILLVVLFILFALIAIAILLQPMTH